MLNVQTKRFGGASGFEQARPGSSSDDLAALHLTGNFLLRELLQTYDFIGVGMVMTDSDGRLLHCNVVADRIFAERDGIELSPSGMVRVGPRNATLTQSIAKQSREIQGSDAGGAPSLTILAVPRPSGKRPLTLLAEFSGPAATPNSLSVAPSLLFVIDPEISRCGMEQYARLIYKFTPAETDLAALLMQGKSLVECGLRMEIRRPTVASHLRQLFRKTQTKTQSQLVSLLFRRCGVLGSGMRSTITPPAALHLVTRTATQQATFVNQKVSQTHSFGGRQ